MVTSSSPQYGPAELNKLTTILEAVFNFLKDKQDVATSPKTLPVSGEKVDPENPALPLEKPHGVIFKVVDEVYVSWIVCLEASINIHRWDSRDYKYKVVDQVSSPAEDKLNEFAFIVRARFGECSASANLFLSSTLISFKIRRLEVQFTSSM
jgi:hypothetical protein